MRIISFLPSVSCFVVFYGFSRFPPPLYSLDRRKSRINPLAPCRAPPRNRFCLQGSPPCTRFSLQGPCPATQRSLQGPALHPATPFEKGVDPKTFLRMGNILSMEGLRTRNAGTVDFGKPIYGHRAPSPLWVFCAFVHGGRHLPKALGFSTMPPACTT